MPRVKIVDIQLGMRVAKEVVNQRGQILIPAGTRIENKHLRGLKIWGIKSVNIVDSDLTDLASETPKNSLDPETRQQIQDYLDTVFCLNVENSKHPIVKQLLTLREQQLIRDGVPEGGLLVPGSRDAEQEAEEILSGIDGTRESRSLEALIEGTKTVASLPNIYFELMDVMKHPFSSAADIAKVISNDPGLTARLLRIVNSAFYSFPAKIDTVSRAITIIGINELSDLAIATTVMNMFGDALDEIIDMSLFWQHSLGCASFTRVLSLRRNEPHMERFFVIGLMHDLGRLLLLAQFPGAVNGALRYSVVKGISLEQAEKTVFGYSHAEAGATLLKTWNLPAAHQQAIGCHHQPQLASSFALEAAITHVADFLTNALCIGYSGSQLIPPLAKEAWDALELDPSILTEVVEEVESLMDDLMDIFSRGN